MIDFSQCYYDFEKTALKPWLISLPDLIENKFDSSSHGHLAEWFDLLEQLPLIVADQFNPKQAIVQIGSQTQLSMTNKQQLVAELKKLIPWRKGPFELFGISIETEWRSDWKWRRLEKQIESLKGRRVLDVGCGNGYYCFRMHAQGAALVVGIEPLMRYHIQFHALSHFLKIRPAIHLLPLTLEAVPEQLPVFDTVFSMGVLYHRRSPIDHLSDLKAFLRPGGELVLETLIIDETIAQVLTPEDRYAKMRNVWFIPSIPLLSTWLNRVGFIDVRVVDISITTEQEQRSTQWMPHESLSDFLDPNDKSLTIEGYPAPSRAILIANKPS